MANSINLFYLSDARYGGWASYTQHVVHALREIGVSSNIYKLGEVTTPQERIFGVGLKYLVLSSQDFIGLCRSSEFNLVTAIGPDARHRPLALKLLEFGARAVVHSADELDNERLALFKEFGVEAIALRKPIGAMMSAKGIYNQVIYQPYKPLYKELTPAKRSTRAVSLSRLDWSKHTDILIHANQELPLEKHVQIFGAAQHLYTFNRLDKIVRNWRKYYCGVYQSKLPQPSRAAVELAAQARYVVDMSYSPNDGSDARYTFLEAWDAGAVLVLHHKWFETGIGLAVPNENCLVISDYKELKSVLKTTKNHDKIRTAGTASLENHTYGKIALQIAEFMGITNA